MPRGRPPSFLRVNKGRPYETILQNRRKACPSENKLHGQLNIPWSTAPKKRIAYPNVGCDGNRKETCSAPRHRIYR